MNLLVSTINDELPNLLKNNVKLSTIGDTSKLPKVTQKKINHARNETKHNDGLGLILALNYSGRWDLLQAMNSILQSSEKKNNLIVERDLNDHLSTSGIPDPELLIRTSGELRISNFFLWQLAYSELIFMDVLWPDFRKKHLKKAIEEFNQRERRFGMTSEQVSIS